MTVNNSNGNGHRGELLAGTHLGKLLKDKPLSVQNQVMEFALDSGMKSNDPAFRLVQYIGYLATLTELAPQEWNELFEEFQQELQAWSHHHLEQLESLALQTATIKELATSCKNLGASCKALTQTSETLFLQFESLIPALQNLSRVSNDLQELQEYLDSPPSLSEQQMESLFRKVVREELSKELRSQLTSKEGKKLKLVELMEIVYQKVVAIPKELKQDTRRGGWSFEYHWSEVLSIALMVCVMLFFIVGGAVRVFSPGMPELVSEQIQEIWQRTDWNMTKLERIENKLGIPINQPQSNSNLQSGQSHLSLMN